MKTTKLFDKITIIEQSALLLKIAFYFSHLQMGEQRCSSTSSSSLYSFLKTSDENSYTNPNSSDEMMPKHVDRPVLSQPFWNERVMLTHSLIFDYQLELQAELRASELFFSCLFLIFISASHAVLFAVQYPQSTLVDHFGVCKSDFCYF